MENGSSERVPSAKNCLWGIYVILDSKIAGRPHDEIVAEAIRGGARVIQLREKALPRREILTLARTLARLCKEAGVAFIVNDHPEIAAEADADGAHIGQEDMSVQEARRILGHQKILGVSTHTFDQALAAMSQPVDYISVGPIFPTRTKENTWPVVGPELVERVRRITTLPITAIGGIKKHDVKSLVLAGADNIAMISEIMLARDIAQYVRELVESFEAAMRERIRRDVSNV